MNYSLNLLLIMFNIKKEDIEYDWLGFKITDDNPISAHHIKKRNDGGEDTPDNIAVLSILSHRYLHEIIEYYAPDVFNKINVLLKKINHSRVYPDLETIKAITELIEEFETSYKKDIKMDLMFKSFNEKKIKKLSDNITLNNPKEFRLLLQSGINPLNTKSSYGNVKKKKKKHRCTDIY